MAKRYIFSIISVIIVALCSSSSYSLDTSHTRQEITGCTGGELKVFKDVRLSEKLYGLPGIDNAGRISPCVYRGRQPVNEGYQTLKNMGIRTVINLRAAHEDRKEVENAGMRYLAFPLPMKNGIRKERLKEIISAMSDPSNQPVYIHCALGQDRTGVVVAAYRMAVEGWSYEDAEKEMQSFGFNNAWIHLKKSLRNFAIEIGKAEKQ